MFVNHLKEFLYTLAYATTQFTIIFAIHLHYSDIITYYLLNGLLAFNKIYAIQVYETVITDLYLAIILTVFTFLPLIWFHFLCYFISGFYDHELKKVYTLYVKLFMIFLLEYSLCLFIFLPHALGRGVFINRYSLLPPTELGLNNVEEGSDISFSIIQIYSYANVITLAVRFLLIWGILVIILRTSKKLTEKRRYLPLIIFIMSLWVTPPDLKLQIMMALGLFLYLEVHIWIKYWKTHVYLLLKPNWLLYLCSCWP